MGVAEVSEDKSCYTCGDETCQLRYVQGIVACVNNWKPKLGAEGEYPCTTLTDTINPPHYTAGAVECIDAIRASMTADEFRGHLKACCIKYLWRYRDKGGVESLKKCRWYLDRLIKEVEGQ